jgi:hypothetical protein
MSVRAGVLSLVALGAAGCASTLSTVRVDKADVDLSRCRAFAWLPAYEDAASLTEQRVRAAVLRELQDKGYAEASERPDCRITYVLSRQERPSQKPRVGVGAGGGSGGVGGGIGVSIPIGRTGQHAGEFTLDVIDVASNSQIWSGTIDAAFRETELSEEEAAAVVEEILAEFPDRAAQP